MALRPFGTLDFESDPFLFKHIPRVFAGDLFFAGRHLLSWSPNCGEILVREAAKLKGAIIYAHNGGKFDFFYILGILLEIFDPEEIELVCIGPRIVEMRCKNDELDITFRDSYSLIPRKLSAFGSKKEIGIWKLCRSSRWLVTKNRKGKYAFAANRDEMIKEGWIRVEIIDGKESWRLIRADVPRLVYKEEIISYLKQDCVALRDGLQQFFDTYGCHLTLAGASFHILKNKFGLKPTKTNEHYDNRFRPYYFSGRVQFFALGKQGRIDGETRYKIVDINSAFPSAMRSKHWFGSEYIELQAPPKKNREICFYEITCDSDGVLPRRAEDKSVEFPHVKRAKFFATGWELFSGIESGKVKNVRYHRIYRPLECKAFTAFVNHFYSLKKDCDEKLKNPNLSPEERSRLEAEREFAKLILNSAYGKFGQDPRSFREVKITLCGQVPEPRYIPVRNGKEGIPGLIQDDGKWYKQIKWEFSYDDLKRGISFWQLPSHNESSSVPLSFYNVATAASITGCVRAFLARSMDSCSGVLYCDTDSILASEISRLKLGDELGEWKLEKECDAVWLGGKKLYAAHSSDPTHKGTKKEWKTASKGVRLTVEDLCAVCEGEEKSYSFDAPNYSVFSPQNFTTRRVNRDDKRKRRNKPAC